MQANRYMNKGVFVNGSQGLSWVIKLALIIEHYIYNLVYMAETYN
mgnify:CR=1 FL=1|jgi:hypothetical protein